MFEREFEFANDLSLTLMTLEKWGEARWVLDTALAAYKKFGKPNPILTANFGLNLIQLKVHTNRPYSAKDRRELERFAEIDSPYPKLGAHILMENWPEAEKQLCRCLDLGPSGRAGINRWPIIELLKPHISNPKTLNKLRRAK